MKTEFDISSFNGWAQLGHWLRKEDPQVPGFVYFVQKDELFIDAQQMELIDKGLDLKTFHSSTPYIELSAGQRVKAKARVSGYLFLNQKGGIDLLPLVCLTEDRLQISLQLFSSVKNQNDFLQFLSDTLSLEKELMALLGLESLPPLRETRTVRPSDLPELFIKSHYVLCPIVRGEAPKESIPDKVIRHPEILKLEAIKTQEPNEFQVCSLHKDELLYEISRGKPGVSGANVFGEIIPTEDYQPFEPPEVDENIIIEQTESGLVLRAKVSGLLTYNNQCLTLSEHLHIHGDVGVKTGDIHFSNDMTVDGNIASGYQVHCEGNVTVLGSIEDKCTVNCQGDLHVAGILGKETLVQCKGHASLHHIQGAHLIVSKSVVVDQYAYNATIDCYETIDVLGAGVDKRKTNAVQGGRLSSFSNMRLHSAGTEMQQTELTIGINLHLCEQLKMLGLEIMTYDENIKKELQYLGWKHGQDFKQLLAQAPASKRERIREKLKDIGELSEKRSKTLNAIETVESQSLIHKKQESLFIEFQKRSFINFTLQIGLKKQELKSFELRKKGSKFILSGGAIQESAD